MQKVTIISKSFTSLPLQWIGPWKRKAGFLRGTQKPKFKANKQCTTVRVEYEKLRKKVFPPLLCVIVGWRSKSPSPHDCGNCDVGLFGISHLGGGAAAMALENG